MNNITTTTIIVIVSERRMEWDGIENMVLFSNEKIFVSSSCFIIIVIIIQDKTQIIFKTKHIKYQKN